MDSSATVSRLSVYPIKSIAPIHQSSAWVEPEGLAFDRRFVLADLQGRFITGRTQPELTQITAALTQNGLKLQAPNQPSLVIEYASFGQEYRSVDVWGSTIQGQHCHDDYDRWFSDYLGKPCQLLFMGHDSHRSVEGSDATVGFADGYPLLLISQASLDELNRRLDKPVTMDHFRPNIVVLDTDAFAEDSWKTIRIGEVTFSVSKPCARCIFTTLDPDTGDFSSDKEPLVTLQQFRRGDDEDTRNEVFFGQNLIPLNEGLIRQDDPVEVLETQTPIHCPDNGDKPVSRPTKTPIPSSKLLKLRCVQVIDETPDVKTFRFHITNGQPVDYLPGQFLTLQLEIKGKPVSRCYTLSSSPSHDGHLSITVKRVEDGQISNWLHDQLIVGSELDALSPSGEFHWQAAGDTDKALLLSAGSGITPMLSMARYLSDTQHPARLMFFHSARTEADLICRPELDLLSQQNPQLSVHYTLTGETTPDWQGLTGRLDKEQLLALVPDLTDYTLFVCGPGKFMESAKQLLTELGVSAERYFEESFGQPPATSEGEGTEISLLYNSWDTQIVGNNRHTLLEQGEEAGLSMAHSCRAGICGICKVRVASGEYQVITNGPLSEQEKANNMVLACSCVPQSDMVIEGPRTET